MGKPFERDETAKWAQAASVISQEHEKVTQGILADYAARGFSFLPGPAMEGVIDLSMAAKNKLAAANGKLYETQREKFFQIDEFELKILVAMGKLAMELYREELLNKLSVEQAEAEAWVIRSRGDIERLQAATELRQAAMIEARAMLEQEINVYREDLIAAETASLGDEILFINAEIETAQARLKIVEALYQVLAAEGLVVAAENRRAAALAREIEAQTRVAEIKKSMVPLYLEKAAAREALADATAKEMPVREDLERLGYARIALKTADEAANEAIRQAENDYDLAQQNRVKAGGAVEIARIQLQRIHREYANQVGAAVIALREGVEEGRIDLHFSRNLAQKQIEAIFEKGLAGSEKAVLAAELVNTLTNIATAGQSRAGTVAASAFRNFTRLSASTRVQRIAKG